LFSHLFEQAQAFLSSTRWMAVQIPTIPYSTRRARAWVRSRAVAVAMVANYGQLDGC
jgi:hypothetical protein